MNKIRQKRKQWWGLGDGMKIKNSTKISVNCERYGVNDGDDDGFADQDIWC